MCVHRNTMPAVGGLAVLGHWICGPHLGSFQTQDLLCIIIVINIRKLIFFQIKDIELQDKKQLFIDIYILRYMAFSQIISNPASS